MVFGFKNSLSNRNKTAYESIHRYVQSRSPDLLGVESFESDIAREINKARIDHLDSLKLPIAQKRVLDVGCGVGHLAQYFVKQRCSVLCVDARDQNIEALRRGYPGLEARVLNVETQDLQPLGRFDVVFCYGLLYHLENPLGFLHKVSAVCQDFLLLETMILDHPRPLMHLVDESLSNDQALHGLAHRPSPSYVTFALTRAGFTHVYSAVRPPRHRDFEFELKGDLSHRRSGANLRMIFVASKKPLTSPELTQIYPPL